MNSGVIAAGVLSQTGNLALAEWLSHIGGSLSQHFTRPNAPLDVVRTPLSLKTKIIAPPAAGWNPPRPSGSKPSARPPGQGEHTGKIHTQGDQKHHEVAARAGTGSTMRVKRDTEKSSAKATIQHIHESAPESDYFIKGGWRQWNGFGARDIPLQGYKLHISATPENAVVVAQLLLPILRRLGVPHKVAESSEMYSEYPDGKFVVVYPRDPKERLRLVRLIDNRLRSNGLDGAENFIPVKKERSLGRSKAIYTRYGAYHRIPAPGNTEGELGLFRANQRGQAVDQYGRPVLHRGRPIYVDRVWRVDEAEYNEIFRKLKREAWVEFDDRDRVAPRWAPPLTARRGR